MWYYSSNEFKNSSVERRAVVFVFYDSDKQKILLEKRGQESYYYGKLIFPGGSVEKNETLEDAVIRESAEEFGVSVLKIEALRPEKTIIGETGVRLFPYLIKEWDGRLPNMILDKGNEIVWVKVEGFTTDIQAVSKVFECFRRRLESVGV